MKFEITERQLTIFWVMLSIPLNRVFKKNYVQEIFRVR